MSGSGAGPAWEPATSDGRPGANRSRPEPARAGRGGRGIRSSSRRPRTVRRPSCRARGAQGRFTGRRRPRGLRTRCRGGDSGLRSRSRWCVTNGRVCRRPPGAAPVSRGGCRGARSSAGSRRG
ncbi:hypothetical protein [Ornithinimicrobium kibberense]|uniref:hypothetical protein n=1 Tax=Ornithinimicrobium kibberense TaxID=282060 RepID=UPI00360DC9BC